MTTNCKALTRRVDARFWKLLSSSILAVATFFGSLTSTDISARADGGLETQKGGLFHRKGWITPSIFRKAPSEKGKYSTSSRSRLGGPVPPVTRDKSRRTKSRLAVRKSKSRKPRASKSATRRIPTQVVRKSERGVTRSARSQTAQPNTRVASLGRELELPSQTTEKKVGSVTGGSARVQWVASSGCVPGRLKAAIHHVAQNFGRVRVNSTCRSRRQNRRVGGASQSWHLKGQAADIRVFGNIGAAARYLRQVVGGFRHYGGGLFHIDTGPRRSW